MASVSGSSERRRSSFQDVVDAFLGESGLPFSSVLSAQLIERVFRRHDNLFGMHAIYSTAVMVWSFLGQVLRDEKEASCQAAVARVVSYRAQLGQSTPTSDTGDYCRARAKISLEALQDLTTVVAANVESQAPPEWLWKGKHAYLVDGFTFTMPDTPANQAEFPSPSSQKEGVGLPIARATAIISLATACVTNVAIGPCQGKETGESALLRGMLDSFQADDVAVFDRYYGSFMMIALLTQRFVHVCARLHHRRHVDFCEGRRLGKNDFLMTWTRPERPEWMDEATYALIPETLELRVLYYNVVRKGVRTTTLTVVTTLTDPREYTAQDIAELYGFRWNVELDIRSIKQTLHLDHVRCKSPEMVRRELWATLLGYNLIRTTTAAAALLHDKQPRQISFTGACQYLLGAWMLFSCRAVPDDQRKERCRQLLEQIAACEVANRPGRYEPRVIKRRRHRYKLMQEPRDVLRAKLANP